MTQVHSIMHSGPIALSFGLAFVGAYCGIHLCEQFRLCSKENQPKLLNRRMLMILMACSIGGVAIWAMHFIGMSAVSFEDPDGNPMPVRYRYDYTLVSLAVVIILCYAGIYICSQDNAYTIDRGDVVDKFIEHARKQSIQEIRQMTTKAKAVQVLIVALTKGIHVIIAGGIVNATGVCVMHYLGMQAIVVDAVIEWDAGIVAASVIIAIVASIAAYWILFRLLALYPYIEVLRLASSIIAAIAVNGMHYTGMAAAKYIYTPGHAASITAISLDGESWMSGALIASMIFLWVVALLVLADVRAWFYTAARTIRITDKIIHDLERDQHQVASTTTALMKYKEMRKANNASTYNDSQSATKRSKHSNSNMRSSRQGSEVPMSELVTNMFSRKNSIVVAMSNQPLAEESKHDGMNSSSAHSAHSDDMQVYNV